MLASTKSRAARAKVVLGKISGAFGVHGQVKVFSYTDPAENILNYAPWLLGAGDDWKTYQPACGEFSGKKLVVQLEGCRNRAQAQILVGREIAINRAQLPDTPAGEYYWSDLQGLQVVSTRHDVLGEVAYLLATGSNDVLVVKGERERLIPYIKGQVIKEIDVDAGRMVVDWDPEF